MHTVKMVSAGSILMHLCKGNCCWSPGSLPLSVPFLCLQRRLREAVQLLEDYKQGTLRPGVTNEQVTLLEVGWGKRKTAELSLSLMKARWEEEDGME